MLEGQLEAEEPKEGTHLEDPCPGAMAAMEKTAVAAEVPREDSNAGEIPSLQQQITRLHQELGRQESLWADVHRKLQSHIDALRKQNLELREELRGLQRQQWEARKKPAASPHVGQESHTPALETAFGKNSPLSVDEETMPKYASRKSQSATLLGQRSSSNNLAPPKPMSLKTERINSGKTPPQEGREKSPPGRRQDRSPAPTGRPTPGAERRGVSEDGKVMHPSSRSLQNSSGRKSPVQASQAATLQEQTAAARGAGTCLGKETEPMRWPSLRCGRASGVVLMRSTAQPCGHHSPWAAWHLDSFPSSAQACVALQGRTRHCLPPRSAPQASCIPDCFMASAGSFTEDHEQLRGRGSAFPSVNHLIHQNTQERVMPKKC
nr:T-complex protein 10A homolog 2 isoform X3 [Pongo pygmaeus]XP_054347423.1 T-complex protein 10A homolog 2 isoform X3 [Pongo pygmaeus]XP_054347425.1 T-complex protein 10A homolog 2 isoform X3 [Pongo pygmaeus]